MTTTFPESHHDLLNAEVATLATVAASGMPQQTAVWFLHEDGKLKLSLNTSRLKTKNLMKRPQCSLLVLDPAVPQRYLEVRGTAEIEPDDDYAFARKLGAKYGGADLSEHDGPGDQPRGRHDPADQRLRRRRAHRADVRPRRVEPPAPRSIASSVRLRSRPPV